jgi:Skp family chaperone for outer membrane proteins
MSPFLEGILAKFAEHGPLGLGFVVMLYAVIQYDKKKDQLTEKIETLQKDSSDDIQQLQREYASTIQQMQRDHATLVQQRQVENAATIQQLQAAHALAIQTMQKDHAREIFDLNRDHAVKIETINRERAEDAEAVAAKLEDMNIKMFNAVNVISDSMDDRFQPPVPQLQPAQADRTARRPGSHPDKKR